MIICYDHLIIIMWTIHFQETACSFVMHAYTNGKDELFSKLNQGETNTIDLLEIN